MANQFPIERNDMFGGRAVAVFSMVRADTVAILRDFSCQPACIRKRRDQIAYQLRLANAARVPADHDQAAWKGFLCCSATHQLAFLASNFLIRDASLRPRAHVFQILVTVTISL